MNYAIMERSTQKIVSGYVGTRISYKFPFADRIAYLHFEVTQPYAEGYYIDDEGNLMYDFDYVAPTPSYDMAKRAELVSIGESFKEMSVNFAVANSEILNTEIGAMAVEGTLDPTDAVAVATFVRSKLDPLVDALAPLFKDITMHYYWRVEHYMALVPREPLLASEERLAQYQADLIAIVRP